MTKTTNIFEQAFIKELNKLAEAEAKEAQNNPTLFDMLELLITTSLDNYKVGGDMQGEPVTDRPCQGAPQYNYDKDDYACQEAPQYVYEKEDFDALPNEIIINTKTGKTTLIFKVDNHRHIETTIVGKGDTFNKETGVIVALLKKNILHNTTYQAIINKAYNFKTPTMTNAYLQGVLNATLLQNEGISIRQVDKLLNAVKELQPGENKTLEFNIYCNTTTNTKIEIR